MKKLFFVLSFIFLSLLLVNAKIEAIGFGIVKPKNHERPYPGKEIAEMLNGDMNYYIGKDNKNIYLTFDMGYENNMTSDILDTLKKENVKACFFVTGHYVRENKDLLMRMINEGHIIANHTNKHKDLTKLSEEEILKEVRDLEDMFKEATNSSLSSYVRPPEGKFDERVLKVLNDKGYKNVLWSLAYVDWKINEQKGKENAYKNIVDYIHNGAIILLHGVSSDNRDALEDIIKELKEQGYNFSSLDEL